MPVETTLHIALAAQAQISAHEQVCAERWAAIREDVATLNSNMDKMNDNLFRGMLALIGVMLSLIGWGGVTLYGQINTALHPAVYPIVQSMVHR